MKTFRVLVVLIATTLFAAAGFAQQPDSVWENSFGFGSEGVPTGLQAISNDGLFANGWSSGLTAQRATLAGFTSDGVQQWLRQDTTLSGHAISFSGHLATIPADNAVVWFEGERGSYDPSWIVKLGADGTERWRLPVNRLMFLGNHTDTSFVSVLPGNNPIAFFYRSNGTVWRQFPLGGTLLAGNHPIAFFRQANGTTSVEFPFSETIEAIVTPVAIGNTLWIGAQYPGGGATSLSYLVAKYDITTGMQLWRRDFVDVARGFITIDPETGDAYVWGTKVVNEPQGLLKYLRARVGAGNGLVWQREEFPRDSLETNYNNFAGGVSVVGSGASKQVVFTGTVQRGDIHTSATDGYALGVRPSNGDSLWLVSRSDGSFCDFRGVVRSGNDGFVLLEAIWQLGQPTTGYGKLLKFTVPTLDVQEIAGTPESFWLHQNYPNPFNPSTTIRFELSARTPVRLAVYDLLGREVAVLVNETLESGIFEATWNAAGAASGTYFYRLQTDRSVATKRMVLLR
ncbi:MAG: hypothetical protein A2Z88_08480 [Omnitrophica WOR_2 bacterium GWA2_47_8]|nr:MAG: hypothetical protein A2Z88_08480 [Omnitrophica WOR_2 bacterium GWA2_47_8]